MLPFSLTDEQLLPLLLENIQDYALFIMDERSRIVRWTPGVEQLLGYDEGEFLGQSGDIIFTPEDKEKGAPDTERRRALQYGRADDIRWHLRKDGTRVWCNGQMIALRDPLGQMQGFAKLMRDETARKHAEQELERAHAQLEMRVEERTSELSMALQQVQALVKRIVSAQEEERGRISRELHDNLGQHLTAVMLGLQALEMQVGQITGGKRQNDVPQLDNLRSLVDGLMKAAHRQAWELRPAELDALGLEAALGQLMSDWSERTGVAIGLEAVGWEMRPTAEIETTLYRVVQEALTNVARHAQATLVSIVLKRTTDTLSVIIEDNGRGFDTEGDTKRLGVLGMQERLAIVGGTLAIESIPGDGTTIIARIPWMKNEKT